MPTTHAHRCSLDLVRERGTPEEVALFERIVGDVRTQGRAQLTGSDAEALRGLVQLLADAHDSEGSR